MRRLRSAVVVLAATAGAGLFLTAGASAQVITLPPITTTTLPPLTDPITDVVGSLVTTTTTVVGGVTVPLPDTSTVSTTLPGVSVTTVPTVDSVVTALVDCTSFATQTLAQQALLADPTLAGVLDPDHDGMACELLPAAPGVPVPTTAPAPGGGSFSSPGVTSASGSSSGSPSSPWGGATSGGTYLSSTQDGGSLADARPDTPGGGRRSAAGTAGTRAVDLTRPAQSAVEAAASSPLPDRDGGADGPAHVLLKVIAFVMLLGVTAAAAGQREQLVSGLVAVRPTPGG